MFQNVLYGCQNLFDVTQTRCFRVFFSLCLVSFSDLLPLWLCWSYSDRRLNINETVWDNLRTQLSSNLEYSVISCFTVVRPPDTLVGDNNICSHICSDSSSEFIQLSLRLSSVAPTPNTWLKRVSRNQPQCRFLLAQVNVFSLSLSLSVSLCLSLSVSCSLSLSLSLCLSVSLALYHSRTHTHSFQLIRLLYSVVNRHSKCWWRRLDQTTYVKYYFFMLIFSVLCCDKVFVLVQFRKHCVLALNTWFCHHKLFWGGSSEAVQVNNSKEYKHFWQPK